MVTSSLAAISARAKRSPTTIVNSTADFARPFLKQSGGPRGRALKSTPRMSVESDAGPVTPPAERSGKTAARDSRMSAYKSDFLNALAERGFIHQISEPEALDARAKAGAITAYIGFDCTAASLHVGSLLPIMMLYWLQETGH